MVVSGFSFIYYILYPPSCNNDLATENRLGVPKSSLDTGDELNNTVVSSPPLLPPVRLFDDVCETSAGVFVSRMVSSSSIVSSQLAMRLETKLRVELEFLMGVFNIFCMEGSDVPRENDWLLAMRGNLIDKGAEAVIASACRCGWCIIEFFLICKSLSLWFCLRVFVCGCDATYDNEGLMEVTPTDTRDSLGVMSLKILVVVRRLTLADLA